MDILLLNAIHAEETHADSIFDLMIRCDVRLTLPFLQENNVFVKYIFRNYIAVRIPKNSIEKIAKNPNIEHFYFDDSKGVPLSDYSRMHSNVDSVFHGHPDLKTAYTGKDVILGIIDAGINFNHPDFRDSSGNTRILALWDHSFQTGGFVPQKYGYGKVFTSSDLNNNNTSHTDQAAYFGHGSNVSGIAAGNGLSVNNNIADYRGMAPDADLIIVSSRFNANNWTMTIADAVDFIFAIADSLNKPCVINVSLGTYLGSHDGLDPAAQFIDSLILAKPGRAMVCAAGNSGDQMPYHLNVDLSNDTGFTWFKYNENFLNPPIFSQKSGAIFLDFYLDSVDLQNLRFSIGADKVSWNNFTFQGETPYYDLSNRVGILKFDTLFTTGGAKIARIISYVEPLDFGTYRVQFYLPSPDSAHFNFRLSTAGTGKFDLWGSKWLGRSDMQAFGLPTTNKFPPISKYIAPDNYQTIVSSWACSPHVITVGNFTNRNSYIDVDGIIQNVSNRMNDIGASSSFGPTRLGLLKPNISAPGDHSIAAGSDAQLKSLTQIPHLRKHLSIGGMHYINGGTSMASPVVAGILALLFEKCNAIPNQELIDSLESTAKKDNYVINGDAMQWGQGKIDALALLWAFTNPVEFSTNNREYCSGDSLEISLNGVWQDVFWNNLIHSPNYFVGKEQTLMSVAIDANGCEQYSDSALFYEKKTPSLNLPSDTSFCENEQLSISTGGFISYVWSDGLQVSSRVFTDTGTYYLQVTDSNGCTASDTLRILSLFTLPEINLGPDTFICAGDTLFVDAGELFESYSWQNQSNLSAINIHQSGIYWIEVTDENSCVNRDSINVNMIPKPLVNLGNDRMICPNTQTQLNASIAGQYLWSTGQTSFSISVSNSGKYWLEVTNSNNCKSSDTINISTFPEPEIPIEKRYIKCPQDTLNLSFNGFNNVVWAGSRPSNNAQYSKQGKYWVSFSDSNSCQRIDTFEIFHYTIPNFGLNDSVFVCQNQIANLFPGSGASTYQWNTGSNTANIIVSNPGLYWVQATDRNSCVYRDSTFLAWHKITPIPIEDEVKICNNQSIAIELDSSFTNVRWSNGSNGNLVQLSKEQQVLVLANDSNTCQTEKLFYIKHYASPALDFSGDTSYCQIDDFYWEFDLNEFSSVKLNGLAFVKTFVLDTAGTYNFTLTDFFGCEFPFKTEIREFPSPVFSLSNFVEDTDDGFQLASPPNMASYLWSTGDTSQILFIDFPEGRQIISLTVSNNFGCYYTDLIELAPNAISDDLDLKRTIQLFPNPATSVLYIKQESFNYKQVQIYSMEGKLVAFRRLENLHTSIDVSSWKSSIYIIKIEDFNGGIFTKKLIVK